MKLEHIYNYVTRYVKDFFFIEMRKWNDENPGIDLLPLSNTKNYTVHSIEHFRYFPDKFFKTQNNRKDLQTWKYKYFKRFQVLKNSFDQQIRNVINYSFNFINITQFISNVAIVPSDRMNCIASSSKEQL